MNRTEHLVCLLLGSNIRATDNLPRSVLLLGKHMTVLKTSSVWESVAIGSDGPNFLNAALLALTPLDAVTLKEGVLLPLEAQMGRVRTEDKNAPRTIDIDIILYDGQLQDPLLWEHAYTALPVAEIVADFQSDDGTILKDFVPDLDTKPAVWRRDDISEYPFLTVFQEYPTKEAMNMERTSMGKIRSKYGEIAPDGVAILGNLEQYLKKTGLESELLELVRVRVSQINGCAYCIDRHTKEARSHHENEQRLYGLSTWKEAPFYSDRERASLLWAESVTIISEDHLPDDVYDSAKLYFSEKELVDLTLAVIAINSWNRLAISFRALPGSYLPDHPVAKKS